MAFIHACVIRRIVFYAGENDLDAGKSVDRVIADFETFVARKSQALGETPVYFISLKPSKLRFAQFPLQTQVNDAIRARAARQCKGFSRSKGHTI